MKKLLIIIAITVLAYYIFYNKFYITGKFNNFLNQYPQSSYTQMIDYSLGVLCSLLGKTDSAIFRFQRVVEIYEAEKFKPAALYNIAQCYEEGKKDKKLALKFYKLVYEKYPGTYYGDLGKSRYEYLLLIGVRED